MQTYILNLLKRLLNIEETLNKKKMQLLWSGDTDDGLSLSLKDDITNYDFLIVVYGTVAGGTISSAIVTPWQDGGWRINQKYDFNFYSANGFCNGYYANTKKIIIEKTPVAIRNIYGVKV